MIIAQMGNFTIIVTQAKLDPVAAAEGPKDGAGAEEKKEGVEGEKKAE